MREGGGGRDAQVGGKGYPFTRHRTKGEIWVTPGPSPYYRAVLDPYYRKRYLSRHIRSSFLPVASLLKSD